MKLNGNIEGMYLIQRELENDSEDYFLVVKNKRALDVAVEEGDDVYKLEKVSYAGRVNLKIELQK